MPVWVNRLCAEEYPIEPAFIDFRDFPDLKDIEPYVLPRFYKRTDFTYVGESKTQVRGPLLTPDGLGLAFADVSYSEWPIVKSIVFKGLFENGQFKSG